MVKLYIMHFCVLVLDSFVFVSLFTFLQIGVVAYTLLCGYEPFYGCDNQDLLKANKAADYKFHRPDWDVISMDAKDFIAKALLSSADERLTPEGARKHVWLKGLFKNSRRASSGAHEDGEGAESGRLKSCVMS